MLQIAALGGALLVPIPPEASMPSPPFSLDAMNALAADRLPGLLGITVVAVDGGAVTLELSVTPSICNLYGKVHGGSLVALADTACGYATIVHLPGDATGFTTIELKTNFLGAATSGTLRCAAVAVHLGRTTQVWDADVLHVESGRRIATFRCTNLVLRAAPSR
jgi:1,4-dihydroxy-2-naphthoyl-CoA hydrolase